MSPLVQNILFTVVGFVGGGIVNMGIVQVGGRMIPLPGVTDPSNMEQIKEGIKKMGPKHAIVPFLAHALGTLAGAFIAAKFSASNNMILAMIIGVMFLAGGIMMVKMLPDTPMWFILLDLIVAYIPMAYLGFILAGGAKV